MAYIGSTVVLTAKFPRDAGNLDLLTDVKVTITDQNQKVMQVITDVTKKSTGVYEVRYLIPPVQKLDYAWSGELNGIVILTRKSLPVVWK